MKLIKLNGNYHWYPEWKYALEFTKQEVHLRHRKHAPYLQAFREVYGDDRWWEPGTFHYRRNKDWWHAPDRRRIYFKDPSVMSFIELKLA